MVLPALERRPGQPAARRQVPSVAEVRLDLLAQAGAQRQVLAGAPVVLHEQAGLPVRVFDQRVAVAPRIRRGDAGLVVGKARERVGAEIVGAQVAAERSALDERPEADGVSAARPVDVGCPLDLVGAAASVLLRAAGGERVEHADRRLFQRGKRIALPSSAAAGAISPNHELAPSGRSRQSAAGAPFRPPARTRDPRGARSRRRRGCADRCRSAGTSPSACATSSTRDRPGP